VKKMLRQIVPQNAQAYRALEIAIAGHLSIKFIGGSEAEMLKNYAVKNGLIAFAFKPCPCGNFGDVGRECVCLPKEITAHQKEINSVKTDMTVEVRRPTAEAIVNFLKTDNKELTKEAWSLLETICEKKYLNTEEAESIIKIAKTIAKMDGWAKVKAEHIAEAYQYSGACRE
jgi:predicted ATPase with chaperone activity